MTRLTAAIDRADDDSAALVQAFALIAAAYVAGGTLHGAKVGGRRGWEALPHLAFWRAARVDHGGEVIFQCFVPLIVCV